MRARRAVAGVLAVGALSLLALGAWPMVPRARTVVVLVDDSASMGVCDEYEPEDLAAITRAAGLREGDVETLSRLELARAVLTSPRPNAFERWAPSGPIRVATLGGRPLAWDAATALTVPDADTSSTALVDALQRVLAHAGDADPPIGAVVLVSDGQETASASDDAETAGRAARDLGVAVHAVLVGAKPRPRNVRVSNLRAPDTALRGDSVTLAFDVDCWPAAELGRVEARWMDDAGTVEDTPFATLDLTPQDGSLRESSTVRLGFVADRGGRFVVGTPARPWELRASDNWLQHTLRIDGRPLRVLYVEGVPRWEFNYLSRYLLRRPAAVRAHVVLFDSEIPPESTEADGWPALTDFDANDLRSRFEDYDVVILGDVDWRSFHPLPEMARETLTALARFVHGGGGLVLVAGSRAMPATYSRTALARLLPVAITPGPAPDFRNGFRVAPTVAGGRSPILDVAGDRAESQRLWETRADWLQYWAYPTAGARPGATVLAVAEGHPGALAGEELPVLAWMPHGRGRTIFIGVDQLWRMRRIVGDRYFGRFYETALREAARGRLAAERPLLRLALDRTTYDAGDSACVELRGELPSDVGMIYAVVTRPGASPDTPQGLISLQHRPAAGPEVLAGSWDPEGPGTWTVRVDHADEVGAPDAVQVEVLQPAPEARDLRPDRACLLRMASASSSGQVVRLADAVRAQLGPPPPGPPDTRLWTAGIALALVSGGVLLVGRRAA